MEFTAVIDNVVRVIEALGVAAIGIGGVAATIGAARRWRRDRALVYAR